ncbi:hypothetical protein RMATCC62417_18065 [Rhizopus microsporus]|nr:hypothetical protein RMATCC62417_18065 [Rhizopus microsporus]
MVIWDMPGVGTKSHPRETYFEDNYLCAFDLLVIVLGNRLMQDDIDISLKAKQYKIPVLQLQVKRLDIKVIKNLYGQQRLENSCWK